MRHALSGLLDGLLSKGGLLMPTWVWTLTLISLVTRRQKSLFPPTVLESQTPRLRSAPFLRLLLSLLCMTPELLCTILLVFFLLGFEPRIYVMPFLMNTSFFISSPFFLFFFSSFITAFLMLLFPLLTWIDDYMAFV